MRASSLTTFCKRPRMKGDATCNRFAHVLFDSACDLGWVCHSEIIPNDLAVFSKAGDKLSPAEQSMRAR